MFIKVLEGDGDLINVATIERVTIDAHDFIKEDNVMHFRLRLVTEGSKYTIAVGTLEFCEQKKLELEPLLNVIPFEPIEMV